MPQHTLSYLGLPSDISFNSRLTDTVPYLGTELLHLYMVRVNHQRAVKVKTFHYVEWSMAK